MLCDAIGIPVKRQTNDEIGTLGIIKMLMVTLGYAKNYDELRINSFTDYYPDVMRHIEYKKLYEKYISYREKMQSYWTVF